MSLSVNDLTPDEVAALQAAQPKYSQFQLQQIQARRSAQAFIDSCPSFDPSESNLSTVVDLMVQNNMDPTVENFTLSYNALNQAGLLEEADDASRPKPEFTLQDIERMSADEYRGHLRDPNFCERVNALEAARKPKPQRPNHARQQFSS